MKIKLLQYKGLFILAFLISSLSYAQTKDSCTFVENDSIITIEMESANLTGTFWVQQNNIPGYLGSGFIQYIGGDATGIPGKNQLSYTFRVKEAGRHSFKMRAYRDGYHDNDVWVRFPHGGVVTKIGNDSTGTMGSEWFKAVIGTRDEWYGFVKTQHLGTAWGEKFHDVYVDFPAPGVYIVEFSGRATGFRIDRFMMYYKKSSYFGMNEANPESPRENCSPYYVGNNPYVANPIPDQTINGNSSWTYTIPANTFGGTSLGYSAYQGSMYPLPSWLTFNEATQTFTGNPTYADGGQYTILVKAEDNGKHAVDAFIITVLGNNPPAMTTPLQDSIANVGLTFTYDVGPNFTDADGHSLTYSATSHEGNLPAWLTLTGSILTGNPTLGDVGNDTIYITVADGNGGMITESFIIRVKPTSVQGISNSISKINGSLYPNPVQDVLYVNMDTHGTGNLSISDPTGKIVYQESYIDMHKEISIDLQSKNLQPGLYILNIESSDKSKMFTGLMIKK